jgi:hypothetical protein
MQQGLQGGSLEKMWVRLFGLGIRKQPWQGLSSKGAKAQTIWDTNLLRKDAS